MSIIDDYKQLRMIENIKNFKEMEVAYKANLKLCKYQEQQINKLATCIEEIKEIAETCNSGVSCSACPYTKECRTDLEAEALGVCKMVLKKCEVLDDICTNKEYGI